MFTSKLKNPSEVQWMVQKDFRERELRKYTPYCSAACFFFNLFFTNTFSTSVLNRIMGNTGLFCMYLPAEELSLVTLH